MSMSTPCTGICKIDSETGLCIGCRRSIEEIGQWLHLPEEERRAIMAELPERSIENQQGHKETT